MIDRHAVLRSPSGQIFPHRTPTSLSLFYNVLEDKCWYSIRITVQKPTWSQISDFNYKLSYNARSPFVYGDYVLMNELKLIVFSHPGPPQKPEKAQTLRSMSPLDNYLDK